MAHRVEKMNINNGIQKMENGKQHTECSTSTKQGV